MDRLKVPVTVLVKAYQQAEMDCMRQGDTKKARRDREFASAVRDALNRILPSCELGAEHLNHSKGVELTPVVANTVRPYLTRIGLL